MERGSVTGCEWQGVNRGNGPAVAGEAAAVLGNAANARAIKR
jgi:hypothetical protein